MLEDPYTHHAFTKPRGFAGDASLIDLFYGHRSGAEAETSTGRFLFETLMRFPSCESVRFRRGYYGAFIDRVTSEQGGKADVLAIACGHMREAKFSRAVTDGAVNLTGIDSDPLAVAEAQRSLALPNVTVRNDSVIDFIRRRAWGETYDGIYASGLFDYLDVRIGRKVVETAFTALRPGGTLSIANYLPTIVEQGYMDLVMDWRLIYRTSSDMLVLTTNLPQDQADVMVWTDPLDAVVYLTVTKRG
ncbi:class I SAM-dependent methyltransferase [Methylobacterium sp. WL69]|uniref:class I SAM-dependent methyltransferase n=1 Tax=Methylobacterium sp. WL69 TaxID=2603893 RepID=UPI0016503D83|nr:class I SAM-dependent methyltransferase [Methylobacterium sp. WL69]